MADAQRSYVRYTGDGAETTFALSFAGENIGYIRASHIRGFVDDVEVPISIDPNSPHLVEFETAPADGSSILIRRDSNLDSPYATFGRGNDFTYQNVNNSFLQQLYLNQEAADGFLPEAFELQQDTNAGGRNVYNLADGTEDDHAVNKGQLDQSASDIRDEIQEYKNEQAIRDQGQDNALANYKNEQAQTDAVQDGRILDLEQSLTEGDLIYRRVTFTATEGQEVFNLNSTTLGVLALYINGVNQIAGEAYELVGDSSIRTLPLEDGDRVVAVIGQEPQYLEPEQVDLRYYREVFFAFEGQSTYTSPYAAGAVMAVYINGVHQTPSYAYSFETATRTITFAEGLEAGDEVLLLLGREPSTNADDLEGKASYESVVGEEGYLGYWSSPRYTSAVAGNTVKHQGVLWEARDDISNILLEAPEDGLWISRGTDGFTFNNIDDLISSSVLNNKYQVIDIKVLGYDVNGDGGACNWVYDGTKDASKYSTMVVESGDIILYLNDGSRCYHKTQVNNRYVYAEQLGIGTPESTATDNNDRYDKFIMADIATFYMLGESYDIIRPFKLYSGKKLLGSALPFRINPQTKTTINQTLDGQSVFVVDNYDLACSAENFVMVYTGGGTSTANALDMNPNAQTSTAGLGSKFKNLYARNFDECYVVGGDGEVGWNWEVSFDNCGGESYSSCCYHIQGFSANCRITDGKGLLGFNTNPTAVAIRVRNGNVYIENFRSENNAWTLDVRGGTVLFNNLYSEGNRNGDIQSRGGNVKGNYMQCAHTNTGVSTTAMINVISGLTNEPVIEIDTVSLSVANGNTLTYLTLLESQCFVDIKSMIWGAGVDTSGVNFTNISAEFNPRYAPNRIGFPQYDFEIRRRELSGQTPWAFTAHRTTFRGFYDDYYLFELPRIDVNGNPTTNYNATRRYSTYTTSAQVDYVNASTDNAVPSWITRASLQP